MNQFVSNSAPVPSSSTSNIRCMTDDEYFSMLPTAYKFKPRDEELILCYLKKKAYNEQLPRNRINEAHVYKYHPEKLTSLMSLGKPKYIPVIDGETKVWYFFCKRKKKYPNGKRPDREAGNGVWKPTTKEKSVTVKGEKIGSRRTLVYHEGKHQNYTKTSWIMHEYTLHNYPPPVPMPDNKMTLNEWVLCKIYKNEKSKKRETSNNNNKEEPTEDIVHENQVMNNDISSIAIQVSESPDIQTSSSSRRLQDIENWNMDMGSSYDYPNNQLMITDEEFHDGNLNDPNFTCFNPALFETTPLMCPFNGPAGNYFTGNMLSMQDSFQMQLPAVNPMPSQVGFQWNQETQIMTRFQEQP